MTNPLWLEIFVVSLGSLVRVAVSFIAAAKRGSLYGAGRIQKEFVIRGE